MALEFFFHDEIVNITFFIVLGVKEIHAGDIALNDNEWHQVHLIRDKERVSINIDNKPVVIQCKCLTQTGLNVSSK